MSLCVWSRFNQILMWPIINYHNLEALASTYLPSLTFGMNEYLSPEGKPAPPRPRKPDFLISSMIQSGPMDKMSLV